jgi:hypothetical protein
MHGRLRTSGASYGPDTVKAMLAAFDEAWAAVRFHFHECPESFEASRMRLADAILAAAANGSPDVGRLKHAGLMSIARAYRLQPTDFRLEVIMPQRVNNPKYWRSYAEVTLTIAEQMNDPECKRLLMGVAETYAELARRALAAGEASGKKRTGTDL